MGGLDRHGDCYTAVTHFPRYHACMVMFIDRKSLKSIKCGKVHIFFVEEGKSIFKSTVEINATRTYTQDGNNRFFETKAKKTQRG